MLVLIHVFSAMSSLGLAGYTLFSPSKSKINAAYALTAVTFLSGSYLILRDKAHILASCLSGLIYLCLISLAIYKSRRRLTIAKINIKEK